MDGLPVRMLPDNPTFQQQVLHILDYMSRNAIAIDKCRYCKVRVAAAFVKQQDVENASVCECKRRKAGNGAPSGAFAFTITKSPKDPYSVGDMLTAVRKLMSQKSNPVVKYAWYYEEKGRDENNDPIHPHIHGMYETSTGGRIETKHFKRAWPIWDPTKPLGAGFRGGYHRPVRSDEGYNNYISKDGMMNESFGLEDDQTE